MPSPALPRADSRRKPRHLRIAVLTALTVITPLAGMSPVAAQGTRAKPADARTVAQRNGCLGCHAIDAALVGPSYHAVAERYRDESGAAAELAQRIRAGVGGRWGVMAMPPQPQVSEADALRLAAWILAGAK